MCGRYALYDDAHVVALQFGLAHEPTFAPSYNIAPGHPILAVRADRSHARNAVLLDWGLVPAWATDPAIGHHLFNARAEHLAQKPSFRNAFLYRRCIVPANGFYEWQTVAGKRLPRYVRPTGSALFGFAGLFESRPHAEGTVGTCAIITVAANELLAPWHDRMPAILGVEHYAHWLDPDHPDPPSLLDVLRPAPTKTMRVDRVSQRVNNVRNDDARLIVAIDEAQGHDGEALF